MQQLSGWIVLDGGNMRQMRFQLLCCMITALIWLILITNIWVSIPLNGLPLVLYFTNYLYSCTSIQPKTYRVLAFAFFDNGLIFNNDPKSQASLYHDLYLEFDVLCCTVYTNQLIFELWSVALWPNSSLTWLDPGSILRPSSSCIRSAPHCIRSSCLSITSMCTTSFDIGMPALGLSSILMTDCPLPLHD